jgi:hypothetical protein
MESASPLLDAHACRLSHPAGIELGLLSCLLQDDMQRLIRDSCRIVFMGGRYDQCVQPISCQKWPPASSFFVALAQFNNRQGRVLQKAQEREFGRAYWFVRASRSVAPQAKRLEVLASMSCVKCNDLCGCNPKWRKQTKHCRLPSPRPLGGRGWPERAG